VDQRSAATIAICGQQPARLPRAHAQNTRRLRRASALPHQAPDSLATMDLIIGDHLGSSSVVINYATGELVERTTYQPYGAVESDYRPSKWKGFREPYKFTGKEEDIEVGATYFGARYYQPYLGRFLSADPLTIHGFMSDLNPYAYVGGRVMTAVDPNGLDPCGGDGTIDCVVVKGPPRGSPERNAELANARAEAIANSTATKRPMPSVPIRPDKVPVPPDWTTQTEWTFPRPDHRLIQPVTSVDTGNRSINFALNKVLLPWRNALAFYGNIPLAIAVGTDDALQNQPDYQAAQVILPMAPAMGLAVETAPAINRLATPFLEWLNAGAAESTLWEWAAPGKNGVTNMEVLLDEVEHLSKTSEGRRRLEDILKFIPNANPQNAAELRWVMNVRNTIESVLRR